MARSSLSYTPLLQDPDPKTEYLAMAERRRILRTELAELDALMDGLLVQISGGAGNGQQRPADEWLTAAEVARKLKVTRQHVYQLGRRGELEVRYLGRVPRYSMAGLERYLARTERPR